MKHKKGAIGFVISVIIAVFLVGAVAYITLHSIGGSVTSILEPLKKLVGIEINKAEASTINTEGCTIKRYYWQPDKARLRDKVSVVIEGQGNCDGKNVKVIVYGRFYNKEKTIPWDNVNGVMIEGNVDMPFKDKVIKKEFILENAPDPGTYMAAAVFTLEFGNFKRTSNELKIIQ